MKTFLTRNIFLLSLVSFFADIASELLFPVTPLFLGSLGYGVIFIGILEGFAACVAGLSKGYFGQLSDHSMSRAPFVRWGYTLSAFAKPLIGLSNAPATIFFSRFTDRMGKGLRTNARDAWLADESLPQNRGKVFGFHRSLDTLGAALGPLLALAYLSQHPNDYRGLFLWAFVPGALSALLSFSVRESQRTARTPASEPKVPKPGFLSFFKYWSIATPDFKRACLALFAFSIINSSDALLLLLLAKNLGNPQSVIIAYIAYNVLYALLGYPLGALADRIGMPKTFSVGLLFFSATYFFMPQVKTLQHAIMVFGIYAIAAAGTESISKAWLTQLVDPKQKASALGFFTAIQSFCLLLASAWTGILWQGFGANVPFYLSAAVSLLLSGFLFFFRHTKTATTEN